MAEQVQVGSWVQQGPANSGSSSGKTSDEPLTYDATQVTAGAASGALIASSTAISRTVTIFIPANATVDANGLAVTVNFGAAAVVAADFPIPAGGTLTVTTLQAINVIRNGASDVTCYVLAGSLT